MKQGALLFLDDEPNVLNALRRVFQDEDIPLLFTTSPEEALEHVRSGAVAVAVSDHRMPAMTGVEFLEKVKKDAPETMRMLLTGHADIKIATEAINRGSVYRFLTKPWVDEELLHTVKQAAAHHALVTENRRLTELTMAQNRQLKDLNENLEEKVRERTRKVVELNRELEKSLLGSVRVMAGLTEVHSKVVGSHSRRVAALSKGMAMKLGLEPDEVLQIEVAALLHDAGKMAIPVELLNKPESALVFKEKELLKRHPVIGETLVSMVPNMEKAARLVRHHHERFIGGGLPEGLKGEHIPLGSRIIAVADAFDNHLNTKAARPSVSRDQALRYIRDQELSEFDPKAVAALEAFLKESGAQGEDEGEVEVVMGELRAGMILSRALRNVRGFLLIPQRTVLTEEIIRTLQAYPESSRSPEGIFIRNTALARP